MREISTYLVTLSNGETKVIHLSGRVKWALERLIEAGQRGCTPITQPAPRWSDYIFRLRGEGIEIETIHEKHGGAFPGHHGKYILRSKVLRKSEVAA